MPSKSRSSGNGGVAASSTTSLPRGREIVRTSAQIVANSPSSSNRSSGDGGVAASSTTSLPRDREIVRTSAQIVANSPSSSNQDHPPSQHEESTARNRRHVLDDVFDDSFEDSMDLIPTDEPDRDEVRPRKRQKRVPHPCHEQYEQEFKPKLQRLNRLARWNYFMEFSIEGMHDIIIAAFGEISVDSYEYSYARQKIQNWTKSWKSKSLQNMLVRYSVTISFKFCLSLTEIGLYPRGERAGKEGPWNKHY
jgi:hypothetical protein